MSRLWYILLALLMMLGLGACATSTPPAAGDGAHNWRKALWTHFLNSVEEAFVRTMTSPDIITLRDARGKPVPTFWDNERRKTRIAVSRLRDSNGRPVPTIWDSERGERRIDVRRLRDSNGRRVPTTWDSERGEYRIDVRRLRGKDGSRVPLRWDAERGEYRVDARRVDPEDLDLAIFDVAQP